MRLPLRISRERRRAGFAIGITLSLLLALPAAHTLLQRPEWFTYDYRMQLWRADRPLNPEIAVVLIDEHSLATMDPLLGRFPWPRAAYAELVAFFHEAGARTVVFDILFSEQQRDGAGSTADDHALAEAGRLAGNVYHAAEFRRELPDENEQAVTPRRLPLEMPARFALPGAGGFPDPGLNAYTLPVPDLLATAQGIGGVGIDPDADGIFRRCNLFFNYQGSVVPAHGVAPILARLGPAHHASDAIRFGDMSVPLDRTGHYLVSLYGDITPYSISGVFATMLQIRKGELEHLVIDPYLFRDKVVFIGSNAVGLQDLKATPLNTRTPGVYIHASVMSNLLDGEFLHQTSRVTTVLLTGTLIFLSVFAIFGTSRFTLQAAAPTVIAAAYGLFAIMAFADGVVFDMALPLTGVALATLATFGYLSFTEGRDKRRVRAMFSQYVSPAVLAEVVSRYEDQIRVEVGTRRRLSILFSDVRGFTSLSEQLQAEQVVDLLNIHYAVMGEIIFRHNGTLDKFIGDAIMAFWGAPIPVADHARQSVSAAIEMVRRLPDVNARLAAKGYPPIDIGIGINTGEMVLGNVGFERKLDYTVIGDHVNLGSRLEGLTKQYGCRIIVAEDTFRELRGEIPCILVDQVRVKGRQAPIRIYQPLALPDDSEDDRTQAQAFAELSELAFSAYEGRDFERALALYARFPEHPLRDLYMQRCRAYLEAPPSADWDGVCNMTTK